ncbi:MAG: hypothetical protein JKY95_16250 [Planctomycetaceae bacterium]|nr:hypothetical protein [Planctomycetaceae bacterium]
MKKHYERRVDIRVCLNLSSAGQAPAWRITGTAYEDNLIIYFKNQEAFIYSTVSPSHHQTEACLTGLFREIIAVTLVAAVPNFWQ